MDEKIVQVNFRMPASLKTDLEKVAQERGRTLTSEIVHRLFQSLDDDRDVGDLHSLLEQSWEARRQMSDVINSQDRALQTIRSSHFALVTLSKHLGQTFLDHSEGQPDFLVGLARLLASFEVEDEGEPSEPVEGLDFSQYPPDPHDEIAKMRNLKKPSE